MNIYSVTIHHHLPGVVGDHYSKTIAANTESEAKKFAIEDFSKGLPFQIGGEVVEVESITLQTSATETIWITQVASMEEFKELDKLVVPAGTYARLKTMGLDLGKVKLEVGHVVVDLMDANDDLGDEQMTITVDHALWLFKDFFKLYDVLPKILVPEGE